ncbi:MAG: PTS fructose transporter subunit IIA [Gammaproteobacteria bacterium]|jgi:PTS system ascorbate-specific IIA component
MSVGLLIITHNGIGNSLLKSAVSIIGNCPLKVENMSVPLNCSPERQNSKGIKLASEVDSGDGVLILTDLYGSTPSNIGRSICQARSASNEKSVLLSGINLAMLVTILNYPDLDLTSMAKKAINGGQKGIMQT